MPAKRKNKPHDIEEPEEQLDNETLLRNRQPEMPVGGLISPLDFQIAFPERLKNRVMFVMLIGFGVSLVLLLLIQSWLVLLAMPLICVAFPFIPIYPIFLKAGAYYVWVDFQYQIYGCIAGGRIRFIRAIDCILWLRNGAFQFPVDFSNMTRISTVGRVQIELVGSGQFFYRPSLIDLSKLDFEEEQFRWNAILRESVNEIQKAFLNSVRDAIQDHLGKLEDDNLWVATVVDLKRFVQRFLDSNRMTLGFSAGEFTLNGEIPGELVSARKQKLSANDKAEAEHAKAFVLFEKLGIQPTEENIIRYLLISRSNNRLRGDVNKLVSGSQNTNTDNAITVSKPPLQTLPASKPLLITAGDENRTPKSDGESFADKSSADALSADRLSVDDLPQSRGLFGRFRGKRKPDDEVIDVELEEADDDDDDAPPMVGHVSKPKPNKPFGPF